MSTPEETATKLVSQISYPLPEDWVNDPEYAAAIREIWPSVVAANMKLISDAIRDDRDHAQAWPCDGEGDESGNFRCRKELRIAGLEHEIAALQSKLALAVRFQLSTGRNAVFVEDRGEMAWCVCDGSLCLNRDGEWEYEPLPSNRDDAFIARTRYSLDEAMTSAKAAILADELGVKS